MEYYGENWSREVKFWSWRVSILFKTVTDVINPLLYKYAIKISRPSQKMAIAPVRGLAKSIDII